MRLSASDCIWLRLAASDCFPPSRLLLTHPPQWVGFVSSHDKSVAISLERQPEAAKVGADEGAVSGGFADDGAVSGGLALGPRVRNALRALHASAAFAFCFGTWGHFDGDRVSGAVWAHLKPEYQSWQRAELLASEAVAHEATLLDGWCAGEAPPPPDRRLAKLDEQARLASYDVGVCPSALLLLQALLPAPPDNWKRASLPSLARHFRKLSAEVRSSTAFHSLPQPSTALHSPPQPSTAFHTLGSPSVVSSRRRR